MPTDLHVHFRLPHAHARKLRAVAETHNTSPSVAARHVLIESLDDILRTEILEQMATVHEELAALKASHRALHEELRAFRADFQAALRRA
jgi:hypothetical protein